MHVNYVYLLHLQTSETSTAAVLHGSQWRICTFAVTFIFYNSFVTKTCCFIWEVTGIVCVRIYFTAHPTMSI